MMDQQLTVYTVGHSNRSAEDFLALLQEGGIEILVDIRATPQSGRFPQFSEDTLRSQLTAAGITYHWAGRQLGGRRPVADDSPHRALPEGLRGYADYMETEPFKRAVSQLLSLAGKAPTAVLCAERQPEDCHRSLLADYLLLQGVEVVHLIQSEEQRPHQLRPEVRRESAALVYDRFSQAGMFDTSV